MKCKICDSDNIVLIGDWTEDLNEYGCGDCGRTIITEPENENEDIEV